MPTTSLELANLVLDRMSVWPAKTALLHPLPSPVVLPDGAASAISDLDCIVGISPTPELLGSLARSVLNPLGLTPVICHPYDHAAVAVFAVASDASAGVHLDLVHDPRGWGRFGIKYMELLSSADTTGRWPTVSPRDQLLYLLRKRQWKGDDDALTELVSRARADYLGVLSRARRVLVSSAMTDVELLLSGSDRARFHRSGASYLATAVRVARRAVFPIGAWIHLSGGNSTLATDVSTKLRRTLVRTKILDLNSERSCHKCWLRDIAGVRWRNGVVISFGPSAPVVPSPDVLVNIGHRSADSVIVEIVEGLSRRLALPYKT